MKSQIGGILIAVLLISVPGTNGQNDINADNNTSYNIYKYGIQIGIIDTEKYPFDSFLRDEQNVFKDLYQEFISLNYTETLDYEEWLVLNNFGLLPDTQESLFDDKDVRADNKENFANTVRRGDILITGKGIAGIIGHSAIMVTDDIVLEMPGGDGWENGIPDNNRQIDKNSWFDIHGSGWIAVYRCPDDDVVNDAATWAKNNYYNPTGGDKKTVHITYKITDDVFVLDPSYCSKLVVHSYYFGTGNRGVIQGLSVFRLIIPTAIPTYFTKPYQLENKGKF